MPTKKSTKKKSTKKSSNKFKPFLNKIIGLIFVLVALALLIFPIHFPTTQKPTALVKSPIVISSKLLLTTKAQDTPVRILIPKVDIDLPIVQARIIDGYWEISETTASYGLGSGYPGASGNTVIFAHARVGLFYNLKDVKLNDIIYVFSKNKWYRYKVNKITAVYPNQIDVIQPTKKETLTLYTCTGFSDEKRLIITAIPQK